MPGAVRLVERLQQRQPVLGGVGAEDVGVAGVHRRDACVAQRVVAGARVLVALDDHRDVARPRSGRPSKVAPLVSSAPMSAARSRGMCARRSSIGDRLGPVAAERSSRHHAQPERLVARGARPAACRGGAPRPRARRSARRPSCAPPSTACSRSTSAASLRQFVPSVFRSPAVSAALQVGDDVAAAERVDGLLRVADQDQRGAAAERAVDHLPLHRVGVLELVDHHDRPALVHPHLRR